MRIPARICGLALAALSLTSCICATPGRSTRTSDESRIEDVSSVPPDPAFLRQDAPGTLVQRLPEVESVGDCAPQHKFVSESRSTCIEGRPCRGFGVQDESGRIFCTCYGETGGCAEGKRCDVRRLTCVPEDDPPSL